MSTALAYLAGAMDSDGCFSIRKSTYHTRIRKDSSNPVYSERLSLKQVTPQIPELLAATFGGAVKLRAAQSANGKPLFVWAVTDKVAAHATSLLRPYLLVKTGQADRVIELRKTKDGPYRRLAYWFELEHPGWREMETINTREAAEILGFKTTVGVTLAIRNGSVLALPGRLKRVCKRMVVEYAEHQARAQDKRGRVRPPQLIAWRERLWQEVRELNKIGLHGTPVYHRTGKFAMA